MIRFCQFAETVFADFVDPVEDVANIFRSGICVNTNGLQRFEFFPQFSVSESPSVVTRLQKNVVGGLF